MKFKTDNERKAAFANMAKAQRQRKLHLKRRDTDALLVSKPGLGWFTKYKPGNKRKAGVKLAAARRKGAARGGQLRFRF